MNEAVKGRRILVVEDNEDVRNVVVVYLRSRGFEVNEAVDGQQGLSEALRLRPDLILLDVLLPRMDGIEVLKSLRGNPDHLQTPVVLMSAVLQSNDLLRQTEPFRVTAFLQKPFQVRVLVETIEEALARRGSSSSNPPPQRRRARITVRDMGSPPTTTRDAVPDERKLVCNTVALPSQGQLSSFPMPRLMHAVFLENRTGRLRLIQKTTEKRIFFQNGYPVYAESSLPEETFGAFLIARKKITREQHEAAITEMSFSGIQYGETLLRFGYLSPHEMVSELELHLMAKVVSTFSWASGMFVFESGDSWKDDVMAARMKPGRLILDGVVSCWTTQAIRDIRVLKEAEATFALEDCPYTSSDLALNTVEARVLQQVQHNHSIAQIVHSSTDKDLALKILFAFYVMQMIGFTAADAHGEVARVSVTSVPPVPSVIPDKAAQASARAEELLAEYVKLRTADYFTLLGVSRNASPAELKQAFENRRQQFHPDRLVGISNGTVHDRIEELHMRIHNAYRILSTPGEKSRYLETLDKPAGNTFLAPRSRTSRQQALPAREDKQKMFEKGIRLLREGLYADALIAFQNAEESESKAKHQAYIVWTRFLLNPESVETAETELKAMFKKVPDEALLPYLLGSLYVRQKKTKEAVGYFEKSLEIDPQNIDAARQLRILRMRQGSESSGLLDLFTKKR